MGNSVRGDKGLQKSSEGDELIIYTLWKDNWGCMMEEELKGGNVVVGRYCLPRFIMCEGARLWAVLSN